MPMQENQQNAPLRFWLVLAMIFAAAMTRLLPHPYNFTPLAAMALFGGACFRKKYWAFLVPLLAMFTSDVVLYAAQYGSYWNNALSTGVLVYGCLALIVVLGLWLRKRKTVLHVATACVAGSMLFFLVTNFGVWLNFDTYPKTIHGLIACYAAGIPFYKNALLGDATFVTVLFGGFAFLENRLPQLRDRLDLVRSEQ